MITPARLIGVGILIFILLFLWSAIIWLLSVSQEPWAAEAGQTLFIIYIYARFFLRWLAVLLFAIGIPWAIWQWWTAPKDEA